MTDTETTTFCTITTRSHLRQTQALINSIRRFMPQVGFIVLLVDGDDCMDGAEVLSIQEVTQTETAQSIVKKYSRKADHLRWSLKPVLISHLLGKGHEQVIYLDNDLYFFSDPSFLFAELQDRSVLLCPHWRIHEPEESKAWFQVNFTDGVYNAGFVGATQAGKEAMDWWARACLYACEQSFKKGLFDDQKYLDLIPAEFENVGILQHKGCNVAFWNVNRHSLSEQDGQVLVNNKWPVVFVHFTAKLEQEIQQGKYPPLAPLLKEYTQAIQ